LDKDIGLAGVLDSFADGIIMIDSHSKIIFANKVAQEIIKEGTEQESDLWPPKVGVFQVNQRIPLRLEELPLIRALSGSEAKEQKIFIKSTHDSEGVFISVNASPLKNSNGDIVGAVASFRDITATLTRERTILAERAFYQKILNFLPVSVRIASPEGTYLYSNNNHRTHLYGEVEGKHISDVFPSEHAKMIIEHNSLTLESRKEMEFSEVLPHVDGTLHFYRAIRFPIFETDGTITGICALSYDETEKIDQQKKIEAERIKNINASKLAALGTLAGEIAHEINNPLGVIKTSAMVLKMMIDGSEPAQNLKDQIEVIDRTSSRVAEIVAALKHVSRDGTKDKFADCSLANLFDDVRALCQTKFKLKSITLKVEPSVNLSTTVRCLRVQVSQVLLNVLVNACDVVENLPKPWIRIRTLEDKDFIYFKIDDSGPGVPKDLQDKIFDPFFTTKELGAGTGLGLSISKDIMKKHGGDIWLDLEEGPSCFSLKLPKVKNQ
jgi:signal transduction histidine kinase